MKLKSDFVILISADAEWQAVLDYYMPSQVRTSPYGNWFSQQFSELSMQVNPIIIMHGGWGKVAAAGSTQYAIACWKPKLLVNLGTCGGFAGRVNVNDMILADETLIYDIYEQMGDPDEHVKHYTTSIDNSWLNDDLLINVIHSRLLSADRDLICDEVQSLQEHFGAIAADWESGAIAWVAAKNNTRCLILRGVTDLVSEQKGDAYDGNAGLFYQNTRTVMRSLLDSLPRLLSRFIDKEDNDIKKADTLKSPLKR